MAALQRLNKLAIFLCGPSTVITSTSSDNRESNQGVIFKRYGKDLIFRRTTLEDVDNYLPNLYEEILGSYYDLKVCLEVCGKDSYSTLFKGKLIGMSVEVNWTDKMRYSGLGHLLREYRGKGFSHLYWKEDVKNFTFQNDKCICCDTILLTFDKIKRDWNMTTQGLSVKFLGIAQSMPCSKSTILKGTDVSMDAIMAFDSKCFVLKNSPIRRPFLERWVCIPGGASFVAIDDNQQVVGFGCRRPAFQPNTHLIGPLYASNDSIAQDLLSKLSADVIGDTLVLSVRMTHHYAVAFALNNGFKAGTFYLRVYAGAPFEDYNDKVYGVTSVSCCGW